MSLEYAKDKVQLGNIDNCWVCEKPINLDGFTTGRMPDCVICDNGHRIHRTCLDAKLPNHICTYNDCGAEITKNCKSSLGYGYFPSRGGKRKTMKNRKTRTNKKKRTKNHKKRKTYKRK
jgi:hypothetical protein